ncbi:MAG: zinc ribbon domain-containing protein, partial [Anaerolineae bacterium]|nr:zinc ribbon domain-containing protein [Anaerolineae bacterium]
MPNYCPKCGTQNRSGARFCVGCGQAFASTSVPSISHVMPTKPPTPTGGQVSPVNQMMSPVNSASVQQQIRSPLSGFNVVSINNISGPVTITKPQLSLADVRNQIDEWVAKQDKHWSSELTGEELTKHLGLVYAAHWILTGAASGNWSASIGVDRTIRIRCSKCSGRGTYRDKDLWGDMTDFTCYKCGGKGYDKSTETDWHSQSGVARGVVDQRIIENVANDTEIRCGRRDLKSSEHQLTKPYADDVFAFALESFDQKVGLAKAKEAVLAALESDASSVASGLGRVRNMRVGHVNIEHLDARTWLYPIYAGKYEYEGSFHLVEVDGMTGKMHIEVPKSIRSKRTTQ